MTANPVCPYCNEPSKLVGGDAIYPHREDLHSKKFYRCVPCKAYVGCHPGTENPLGRLANAELRRAKVNAHQAFDHIWKGGDLSRSDAYYWLATQLGIPAKGCHIGRFDLDMCAKVVKVSAGYTFESLRTGIPKQQQLWDICRKWIKDNDVTCGESLYQVDSVQEAMYDLATEICELVGYHQDG